MSDRWRSMERLIRRGEVARALTTTGPIRTVPTPLDVPVVHKPDTTVWTESGDGERRCWHVAGDGSLHETPESLTWSAERAAARAVRGQW